MKVKFSVCSTSLTRIVFQLAIAPLAITAIAFLSFAFPPAAIASEDRYSQLMNLRMEVEALNDSWEAEKKRSKAEYEKVLERLAALKDETAKQESTLGLTRARIRGFKTLEAESRRVTGQEETRLRKSVELVRADLEKMLPVGRKQSLERIRELLSGFEQRSAEEIAESLSKVMRDEVVKARGLHLFRETHNLAGVETPLEIARVGNVYAYVADANGRFGFWIPGSKEPSWDLPQSETKKAKQILDHARTAKKTVSIEAGVAEAAIFGGGK
jgi:hypothetical protein